MAEIYITEYRKVGFGTDLMVPIAFEGDGVVRRAPVDFSGGVQLADAFAADTRFVEVWADADCLYAVGSDPDASEAGTPLTAKYPKQFVVRPGDKLSVVGI